MTWWIWVLFGLFLMLVELVTPGGFYLMFFGCGAVVVGLLSALEAGGPEWMQWLLFSGISVIAVLLFRRRLVERFRPVAQGREVDSLVGETAQALEEIASGGIGKAELRGTSWSVRNVGEKPVTLGQRCSVERVEGLMLWVRGQP